MQLKLHGSHPQLPNQRALKPLLLSLIKPKINIMELLQGKLALPRTTDAVPHALHVLNTH
jgi:hypothetical protein